MAEKVSTIILKVDLDCHKCNKKIRAVLCKLQDRYNIETTVYDEKNNTVTLTGPFCPHRLAKKLCCKACKVIREIEIIYSGGGGDGSGGEGGGEADSGGGKTGSRGAEADSGDGETGSGGGETGSGGGGGDSGGGEGGGADSWGGETGSGGGGIDSGGGETGSGCPKIKLVPPCFYPVPVWPVYPACPPPICCRPCKEVGTCRCTCDRGRPCSGPPPPRPCCDGGYKVEFFTEQDQGCRIM